MTFTPAAALDGYVLESTEARDLDDDDDARADDIGCYPGNSSNAANRPQLVVTYQ